MRALLLALCLFALACGDSAPAGVPDAAASDAGGQPLDGGDDREDAGGETPDAGDDTADAGEEGPDAGEEGPDAGDDPPDAGPVRTAPGQCGSDSDCTTGDCNTRGPGGICFGCSSDADCDLGNGESYTCHELFFSCNQDCDADEDCPAGLRCNTADGVCVLERCSDCPAPYVCEGTVCVRPPCDENCPTGACSEGYCVTDL